MVTIIGLMQPDWELSYVNFIYVLCQKVYYAGYIYIETPSILKKTKVVT